MVSFIAFQHFLTTIGRSTYSAIIIGANGITGAHMVWVLAESSRGWEAIYALSWRPPNTEAAPNVRNLAIDFLTLPNEIAKILKENNAKA